MVEEEALDDDPLGDQVERGDGDWLAAHQSIDDQRPGLAENAGYGCAGFAGDPINAERHAGVADRCPNFVDRPTLIDDHEVAADGLQLGNELGAANEVDCLEAARPGNGQHSPYPFISDDARQRRPDRIYTLDEIQVIHVDRRMLDTDQHLACGRCWRFGKVGKLEDDSRLAESSDSHCTHSAPPVLVMAEFDEVAAGERSPGLLQAATRREIAEIDRREAETLDELFDECGRFGMVPRDEDHATSSVLDRPFIEAGGNDRIERLDDAGTWRQGRHDLARALAAEIGEDELRSRLDEGIRRIDEHPAVPGG